MDYLQNGNIANSVNMPAISMPREPGCIRICIVHHNVPNTISVLAGALGESGLNIEDMQSKSRKDYAYAVFEVSGSANINEEKIAALPGIIKVRVIK